MRPLTIAYVTVDDARDRRSWSGIHYHLAEELRAQGHTVLLLGPLRPQPLLFALQVLNKLGLLLFRKRFHYRDSFPMARAYARILQRRLKDVRADLLLAPAGLAPIALLRTELPIVHFNDRSIAGALAYHRILRDLFAGSREQSLALERRALANAALTVYASEWAASAARNALPEAASRVKVIPMGANFEEMPAVPAQRSFPGRIITLLFIGVDWVDKGGAIAYDALKRIKEQGVHARLVVCGCDVPPGFDDPDLVREGFLSKNDPVQKARLLDHLRSADFFILPTRFEAYGIAFCEAAAFGLPALGTRTGGVPTIVKEGVTGYLFPPEAGGEAYAGRILELVRDPSKWAEMRAAARYRYESTFTWKAFVHALLDQVEAAGLVSSSR